MADSEQEHVGYEKMEICSVDPFGLPPNGFVQENRRRMRVEMTDIQDYYLILTTSFVLRKKVF